MKLVRTEGEINELLNEVQYATADGQERFPGMSYEEGVAAALLWVIGDTDDPPYPES